MDLPHNLQQLQGFAPLSARPSAGYPRLGEEPFSSTLNAQAANALSQMNLRPSGGFVERSPSLRDLAQTMPSSSSFQLSGPAMLVGTVAALQEESGQLRSQWKSDVARLEGELDQLRTAASWALPHLSEVQRQQDFRTASSTNPVAMLQHSNLERSSHIGVPVSPRANPGALHLPEHASMQAQEQAAQKITEALLAQMRATAAECSLAGLSRQSGPAPPLSEASLDCSYCSAPFGATMAHSVAQSGQHASEVPRSSQETAKSGLALEEMHKELRRMEAVLQQAREENAKLREEKRAVEEAHKRDVSSLEAMLNQIMAENKRLTEVGSTPHGTTQKIDKVDFSNGMNIKQQVPVTPFEPEMERSTEFDRNFNVGINSRSHQYMH